MKEEIKKMIEEIKIRRNNEQYRGGPFPIYHIEFDILNEEIERLNNIINELEKYSKDRYYEEKKLDHYSSLNTYKDIWNKIKELKGNDKE